jgi:hypothetical protein
MKTEVCKFNGNAITFVVNKESTMVNATEMAKVFGKQVNEFMSSDRTQAFIASCLKNGKFLFSGSVIEKEDDLFISQKRSGTWMHRILALKFAAWLNPDFEVWVYCTIENLLFGRYIKLEQSYERTVSLQREVEELRCNPNKTGEDFERYLQVQKALKDETSLRRSLTLEGVSNSKGII